MALTSLRTADIFFIAVWIEFEYHCEINPGSSKAESGLQHVQTRKIGFFHDHVGSF
jgi:hypothetical protein